MKKIAAITALVLALVLVLSACGSKIEGKWKVNDPTKMGLDKDGSVIFEFKSGKLTISMKQGSMSATVEGTYKVDGKNLTLSYEGNDGKGTYEISGKTLKITMDGETLEFTKQ